MSDSLVSRVLISILSSVGLLSRNAGFQYPLIFVQEPIHCQPYKRKSVQFQGRLHEFSVEWAILDNTEGT